jgi:hypothetical protein
VASARATRTVAGFADTSTMRARPASSTWVSLRRVRFLVARRAAMARTIGAGTADPKDALHGTGSGIRGCEAVRDAL